MRPIRRLFSQSSGSEFKGGGKPPYCDAAIAADVAHLRVVIACYKRLRSQGASIRGAKFAACDRETEEVAKQLEIYLALEKL